MFKPFIRPSLLVMGSAIALSLLSPTSAFSKLNGQTQNNAIAQAQLSGERENSIDSVLQAVFNNLRNPDAGAAQITISRANDFVESPTQSTLTITTKGYLDDSVNGHKTIIRMKKLSDGSWTVTDNQKLTICKLGRGSQTGSTKLCL